MTFLDQIDLRKDPLATAYVKNEVVQVRFATHAGVLTSSVGLNQYQSGDALITGSNGDTWCVSRDRFNPKYFPEGGHQHGADGAYRNFPKPILAKQIQHDFSLARSVGGDILHGKAGDWLVQYAPGDHGLVDALRFAKVYFLA